MFDQAWDLSVVFAAALLVKGKWGVGRQKRRVLGSIKGLVNHGPKIQEVPIQWILRQPSSGAIWLLWRGFAAGRWWQRTDWVVTDLERPSCNVTVDLCDLSPYLFRLPATFFGLQYTWTNTMHDITQYTFELSQCCISHYWSQYVTTETWTCDQG